MGAVASMALPLLSRGPDRLKLPHGVLGVWTGQAYAYIVHDKEGVVLIDAGGDPGGSALLTEMRQLGFEASDVKAILLTHGHNDHWAAAALFRRAVVYVSPEDHYLVRGDKLPKGPLVRLVTRLREQPPLPPRIRTPLAGAVLRFDSLRFEVIATPGHTAGSRMYLYQDILFSGDSLLLCDEGTQLAPWLFSDSQRDNQQALFRLRGVQFQGLADGHGGFAPDGQQRYRAWLAGTEME